MFAGLRGVVWSILVVFGLVLTLGLFGLPGRVCGYGSDFFAGLVFGLGCWLVSFWLVWYISGWVEWFWLPDGLVGG